MRSLFGLLRENRQQLDATMNNESKFEPGKALHEVLRGKSSTALWSDLKPDMVKMLKESELTVVRAFCDEVGRRSEIMRVNLKVGEDYAYRRVRRELLAEYEKASK